MGLRCARKAASFAAFSSFDHGHAVKIGLTATPALHTVQIFGEPIFTYSYREAVIDGYLIDHEPPIRIETELTRAGITFQRDEQLEMAKEARPVPAGARDLSSDHGQTRIVLSGPPHCAGHRRRHRDGGYVGQRDLVPPFARRQGGCPLCRPHRFAG
jgi:hypothetical protein